MLTPWKLAMLALLAFMLLQRVGGAPWPFHKLRTWLAVFGSSVAAYLVTPAEGFAPPVAYVAIDFIAGCIVLARPAGNAQKAIGFLYAAMILFHCGAGLAGNYSGDGHYRTFLISAGWAQWGILLAWSSWDVGKAFLARLGLLGGVAPDLAGKGGAQ